MPTRSAARAACIVSPRAALPALIALVVAACAGLHDPHPSADQVAEQNGMRRLEVPGSGFRHRVYIRGELAGAARIHVYLEGDGLPWSSRTRISPDPTPLDPVALRLMARDPTPAVYLGRPCYFGLARSAGCSPWTWTQGRYGREVVASLAGAAERVLPSDADRHLTLIGYSGGGALAVLLAGRLAGVDRLVTIGADLDIDAWADAHGYSRLEGSLDPATQPPLDARIAQLHLAGERDEVVPVGSLRAYLVRNPRARLRVIPGFDHRCCWAEVWPELLGETR